MWKYRVCKDGLKRKEEEKERCENVVKEGKSYFEKLPLNKSCVNRFW